MRWLISLCLSFTAVLALTWQVSCPILAHRHLCVLFLNLSLAGIRRFGSRAHAGPGGVRSLHVEPLIFGSFAGLAFDALVVFNHVSGIFPCAGAH